MIVEFEILTAMVMKRTVFWDTTPCSPLKVNRRFGKEYLHLQEIEQDTSVKARGKQSYTAL
jgi:hypothetical protein